MRQSMREQNTRSKRSMEDHRSHRPGHSSQTDRPRGDRPQSSRAGSSHNITTYTHQVTKDGERVAVQVISTTDVDMPDQEMDGYHGQSTAISQVPLVPQRPEQLSYESFHNPISSETQRDLPCPRDLQNPRDITQGPAGYPPREIGSSRPSVQEYHGGNDPRSGNNKSQGKQPPAPPPKNRNSSYQTQTSRDKQHDNRGGGGGGVWGSIFGGGSSSESDLKSRLEECDRQRVEAVNNLVKSESNLLNAVTQRSKLEEEVKELRKTKAEQDVQVRKAQELMLKNTKTTNGLAEEDKTIRHNFKNLQTVIRDFGRDWANKDITVVERWEPETDRTEIFKVLARVVRIDNGTLPKGLTSNKSIAGRASAICLSALVSDIICEEIFERPFCALQGEINLIGPGADQAIKERPDLWKGRLVPKDDKVLEEVYRELAQCDEKKAQQWRCLMLNILDPASSDPTDIITAKASARRAAISRERAERFMKSPPRVLCRKLSAPEEAKCTEALQSILQEALEISSRIWKQPPILKGERLVDLSLKIFTATSDLMDAHSLHRLGLGDDEDDDSTRLDHHRILMVVSPAILGMGNSDGENYAQHRVWAKAVVWLEE